LCAPSRCSRQVHTPTHTRARMHTHACTHTHSHTRKHARAHPRAPMSLPHTHFPLPSLFCTRAFLPAVSPAHAWVFFRRCSWLCVLPPVLCEVRVYAYHLFPDCPGRDAPVAHFKWHQDAVTSIEWRPDDENEIVVTSADNTVCKAGWAGGAGRGGAGTAWQGGGGCFFVYVPPPATLLFRRRAAARHASEGVGVCLCRLRVCASLFCSDPEVLLPCRECPVP
jgi:hypothetical protein